MNEIKDSRIERTLIVMPEPIEWILSGRKIGGYEADQPKYVDE